MAYVGLFCALTAVGAIFSIQIMQLVPFSLQVLFTLLSGAVLGSRLGSLSQASYVLMGLIGLPVFAMRRAGLGVLFGPTGGFLIGFIAGAAVTGWVVERMADQVQSRFGKIAVVFLAFLLGVVTIYIPGVLWLAYHVGGLKAALVSMLPLLPADIVKACAGTVLYSILHSRGILRYTNRTTPTVT